MRTEASWLQSAKGATEATIPVEDSFARRSLNIISSKIQRDTWIAAILSTAVCCLLGIWEIV